MWRFGRRLDTADVGAAHDADGAVRVDGYVDLMRRLEWAPPDSQALVVVGPDVVLAHRGRNCVAVLDPATGTAAALPTDPGELRLVALPGTMPLDDRLDELNAARFGAAVQPSWPIVWPAQAHPYEDGSDAPFVVIGPVDDEP